MSEPRSDEVPQAKAVVGGKLGGDVPRGGAAGAGRETQKRRVSNFLLDKSLQLRYVLAVTVISTVISGVLGFLIYRQEHNATAALASDLGTFGDLDLQREVTRSMEAGDSGIVLTMVGIGVGLLIVLSVFLLVMTHKVAGPLYKVSVHFDEMAAGRLGSVAGPRKGDMLQDFYVNFRDMHEATRARVAAEAKTMQAVADACAAAQLGAGADGPTAALAQVAQRRRSALG